MAKTNGVRGAVAAAAAALIAISGCSDSGEDEPGEGAPMFLSSRGGGCWGLVEAAVAEHGIDDVAASAG
jgi:hypothetical protein